MTVTSGIVITVAPGISVTAVSGAAGYLRNCDLRIAITTTSDIAKTVASCIATNGT